MIDTEKLSRLLEELDIVVDGYAAQRLDLYAQRLVAWNEKMNLTGITDPEGILEKHFIDSIEPLRFLEIPRNARVIDVGTGAGFPGLPLLIARPDLDLTLADSLHKRLVFLEDVLQPPAVGGGIAGARRQLAHALRSVGQAFLRKGLGLLLHGQTIADQCLEGLATLSLRFRKGAKASQPDVV